MRMTLSLVLVSLLTACAVDPAVDPGDDPGTDVSASDVRVNPKTDLLEPAFVNGTLCSIVFQGGLTPQTQTYEIWAVGTHGIIANAPYNTAGTPNLYAVFGTNAAASVTHHVDGFDQFDHYHVLDNKYGTDVDNRKWDLLAFFPGPNYNAATYKPARSTSEVLAQSAAGVLGPLLTTVDIGFPPVVLNFPVNCPHGH
jgi:hypothetical protein